jgi:Cell division protein FtsI/penicillin-binding protein 2
LATIKYQRLGCRPERENGDVLAMVSYPNYENNRMSKVIPGYYYNQLTQDQAKPLVNQAISAELPPGSVFKLVSALGILNEGVVTPEYTVDDPGTISLVQKFYENDPGSLQTYYCWDRAGHGPVDYLHGIAWSCNVYWYKVTGGYGTEIPGNGLGIWRLGEYARALGYGALTGVELPGEADGLIPNPTWKRLNQGENWATGDTVSGSRGSGLRSGYAAASGAFYINHREQWQTDEAFTYQQGGSRGRHGNPTI